MRNHQINAKEFIIGAAVGSLLGSVAALFMAPKSGKRLRQDLCDAYCDAADTTQQFARKGKSLAKNMSCQTCDWAGKAKSAMDGMTKTVKGWVGEEEVEEETTRDLLVGGLAGAVLGAVAGLLMAPKPGEELRQDIADTYEDVSDRTHEFTNDVSKKGKAFAKQAKTRANKWLNLAHQLVDDLTENVEDTSGDILDKAKEVVQNHRIQDMMDWAALGFRLWQGIKSRR